MKRTIVALAVLGLLAGASSVFAGGSGVSGQYRSIDLYGQYVETFEVPTGSPIAGLCVLTFDGISKLVSSQSLCYIVNTSAACPQSVSGTYTVNTNGTGWISGTLAAAGGSCPAQPFNETLVIQEISLSPMPVAENVQFIRTDTGEVASGELVPQGGSKFQNTSLEFGNGYTEAITGTTSGNSFAALCSEQFNGQGGAVAPGPYGAVTGNCTLNTAGIGACQYRLAGNYGIVSSSYASSPAAPGYGFSFGTLTATSGSPCPATLPYSEVLRIISGGFSNSLFIANEVEAISIVSGEIATGTYLPLP